MKHNKTVLTFLSRLELPHLKGVSKSELMICDSRSSDSVPLEHVKLVRNLARIFFFHSSQTEAAKTSADYVQLTIYVTTYYLESYNKSPSRKDDMFLGEVGR